MYSRMESVSHSSQMGVTSTLYGAQRFASLRIHAELVISAMKGAVASSAASPGA